MTRRTDAQIVRDVLGGNGSAFEELVHRYERAIFNTAYRILNDIDDATDATQSAFLKAFENLASYNPKYKFFSWMYRIALNETLNMNRMKTLHVPVGEELIGQDISVEEHMERQEAERRLEWAINTLPPEYKEVIILCHLREMSYSEAAYAIGIPEKLVKSRLYTARNLLRSLYFRNNG